MGMPKLPRIEHELVFTQIGQSLFMGRLMGYRSPLLDEIVPHGGERYLLVRLDPQPLV